jgi:hypothetical protein
MPPICVLSNARWTSATKVPSVTSAERQPEHDGGDGHEVAPRLVVSWPSVASATSE